MEQFERDVLVSRDITGRPFAFFPPLCTLYRLTDSETAGKITDDEEYSFVDIANFHDIEKDSLRFKQKKIKSKRPDALAIILTQSCNLSCSYCLAKKGTFGLPVSEFSVEKLERYLEKIFNENNDIKFVKFFGGEPTLRMDLIEHACHYISNNIGKHVIFGMTTNGSLNAKEHVEIYKKYHINLSVSIDGPENIHDQARIDKKGNGNFKKAVNYCNSLKEGGFPFAVVAVFDERHLDKKFSLIELVKFLNKISKISKIQIVESLGDSQQNCFQQESVKEIKRQAFEAVDAILNYSISNWVNIGDEEWIYENNIYRYLEGVISGNAIPDSYSCTASCLTSLFPSGLMMPCYTLSEKEEYLWGNIELLDHVTLTSLRGKFKNNIKWSSIYSHFNISPWYRGIVGDICFTDMLNCIDTGRKNLYSSFQEYTALRMLQHVAGVHDQPIKYARLVNSTEQHRRMAGIKIA